MQGFRTAVKMWKYLEKAYQQSNLARKFQIENDIFVPKLTMNLISLAQLVEEGNILS